MSFLLTARGSQQNYITEKESCVSAKNLVTLIFKSVTH